MTDSAETRAIDTYLERAHRRWSDEGLPSRDQLRAAAEEAGMSAEASEMADEQAGELTKQAQKALDDGDKERGEELLGDAILLSPIRAQPHILLGELYAERYADDGDRRHRERALELAQRAQSLAPDDVSARNLIEKLGEAPQDSLSWKIAALIVLVIVAISGTMQLCHRYYVAPEVTDEQTEAVREYLEEHGDPRR